MPGALLAFNVQCLTLNYQRSTSGTLSIEPQVMTSDVLTRRWNSHCDACLADFGIST